MMVLQETATGNVRCAATPGRGADGPTRSLLVFNCHEPWVYQLSGLAYRLDIVVGLRGRYFAGWDRQMRPLPAGARLISLPQALRSANEYDCIITHNITDLIEARSRPEPRLIVLHSSLEGRYTEEHTDVSPEQMRGRLDRYLQLIGAHAVATSLFKGESWGQTDDIVHCGVDVEEYLPYSGREACGLRICNFVNSRRSIVPRQQKWHRVEIRVRGEVQEYSCMQEYS